MKMGPNKALQVTAHKAPNLNADVQRPEMMKKNDELAMATLTARKLEKKSALRREI